MSAIFLDTLFYIYIRYSFIYLLNFIEVAMFSGSMTDEGLFTYLLTYVISFPIYLVSGEEGGYDFFDWATGFWRDLDCLTGRYVCKWLVILSTKYE